MKIKINYILLLILLFFSKLGISQNIYPNTDNIWKIIIEEFNLNHHVAQYEVKKQIQWIIQHPGYLEKLAAARPYLYHIVNEIKKRKMPGEIALLPMLESTYNPFAYSKAGAAGLWQFMPQTAKELGLRQDWWIDDRRNVHSSTSAALTYLLYLNKVFQGNWVLALAAYDSGEGTVKRALRKHKQSPLNSNFWSLSLPGETKAYIPRLLALAEVIKNHKKYRVKIPPIPHYPYFKKVKVSVPINLTQAAKLADVPYKDFMQLNPGFNRWTTVPNKPYVLLIPTNKITIFQRNLIFLTPQQQAQWKSYRVKKGDSLDSIARNHFTTTSLLCAINQLNSKNLRPAQIILIPGINYDVREEKQKIVKNILHPQQIYKILHIVQKGEDLATISKKYAINADIIQQWNKNHLKPKPPVGQKIIIWKNNNTNTT